MRMFLYLIEHGNPFCEPMTEVAWAGDADEADRHVGWMLLRETPKEDLAEPAGKLDAWEVERREIVMPDGAGVSKVVGEPAKLKFVWNGLDWVSEAG